LSVVVAAVAEIAAAVAVREAIWLTAQTIIPFQWVPTILLSVLMVPEVTAVLQLGAVTAVTLLSMV
jgi:hypothetical protein